VTGERCETFKHGTDDRCPETTTSEYVIGCLHEHVRRACLCAGHVSQANRGINYCRRCHRGTEPHECRILAQPVMAGAS
jgi:hypothetical protein